DQAPVQVVARQGSNNTADAPENGQPGRTTDQSNEQPIGGGQTNTAGGDSRSDSDGAFGSPSPTTDGNGDDFNGPPPTAAEGAVDASSDPSQSPPSFTEQPGSIDLGTGAPVIVVDSSSAIGVIRIDADPNVIVRIGDGDRADSEIGIDQELVLLKQRQQQ